MYDPQLVIEQELQEGEKLLWSAQPKQGFLINKPDYHNIIFGIVWTSFALFWEYQVFQQENPRLANIDDARTVCNLLKSLIDEHHA